MHNPLRIQLLENIAHIIALVRPILEAVAEQDRSLANQLRRALSERPRPTPLRRVARFRPDPRGLRRSDGLVGQRDEFAAESGTGGEVEVGGRLHAGALRALHERVQNRCGLGSAL